ncbi:MAG: dihydroorotate dehydrogenase electron transfer subunit, partial [Candidatus Cloacimonadota bacterium]|nr:dihydroorotate dehydrogenase electron transfer subunit [Candidatus Cloacimonadota bacterium]
MRQGLFKVIQNETINDQYFVLTIEAPSLADITKPGQFFEVKSDFQLLRIPISIYNVDDDKIQLMIKIIGDGTKKLSEIKANETIDLIGPLGNNFSIEENKKVLLVSGGIGYPPLSFLKKNLSACETFWIHGGRTKEDIFPADLVYTDD